MRALIAGLALVITAVAVVLVAGQSKFPPATFEFGKYGTYTGVLRNQPYPALEMANGDRVPLVGEGKHGADSMVAGAVGRRVEIRASRISRDRDLMLEIVPSSLKALGDPIPDAAPRDGRGVRLRGEVVDAKCYLGVMNPGSGKVHQDCAIRCISGGVPPALLVRDQEGRTRVFMLTGMPMKDFAGLLVEIEGSLRGKEIEVWKTTKL